MLGHSATVEDRRDVAGVPAQVAPPVGVAAPQAVPTSAPRDASGPLSIPDPAVLDHLAGADPATRRLGYAGKRALDLFGAVVGLILLAPLFAVVSLAILIDDGRPVFFRQPRAGRYGRSFTIVKFRSMHDGADALRAGLRVQNEVSGGASFKMTHDPRVTRLGRFLRRTSIDELPQLWNVLRGDMSLVGPRPHPFDDLDGYAEWHYARLAMKPGMTGLWQVSARRDSDFDRWVQQDLDYIRRWSLASTYACSCRPSPPSCAAAGGRPAMTATPARVAVIGCGHVGLVMAAGLAELGHDVHGIDATRPSSEALQRGVVRLQRTRPSRARRRRASRAAVCVSRPATRRRSRRRSSSSSRSTRRRRWPARPTCATSGRRHAPSPPPSMARPDHHQQEHLADRYRRDDRGRSSSSPSSGSTTCRASCRTPNSCARAGPCDDFFNPDRIVVGSRGRGGCPGRREPLRRPARRGHPHRPAHGRDDQVRRQLVPRHAHLVHQRDRPPVRADRRRRRPGRRGHRPRSRAIGPPLLPSRHRLRRQLPAQGRRSPALHRRDLRRGDAGPLGASRRSTPPSGRAPSGGCARASARSRASRSGSGA